MCFMCGPPMACEEPSAREDSSLFLLLPMGLKDAIARGRQVQQQSSFSSLSYHTHHGGRHLKPCNYLKQAVLCKHQQRPQIPQLGSAVTSPQGQRWEISLIFKEKKLKIVKKRRF